MILHSMIQHHHWNLRDIEDLIPWERDIYVGLLINYLEEEKEAMERNK